jgi:hypothetical protein
MTGNALICTADHGMATSVATRGVVKYADFANRTITANIPEHVWITKSGIAAGVATRGIIPRPINLTSRASHAQLTLDLLV